VAQLQQVLLYKVFQVAQMLMVVQAVQVLQVLFLLLQSLIVKVEEVEYGMALTQDVIMQALILEMLVEVAEQVMHIPVKQAVMADLV
jgi:hypothetical protein